MCSALTHIRTGMFSDHQPNKGVLLREAREPDQLADPYLEPIQSTIQEQLAAAATAAANAGDIQEELHRAEA